MRRPGIEPPNYTQVPNVLLDSVMREVSPAEWKCLCYIARQTFGWHREYTASQYSSLMDIARGTGLHKNGVIKSLKALHDRHRLIAWRMDPKTGAKSYGIRLELEPADHSESVPSEPSTQSRPGTGTQSRPGRSTESTTIKEEGIDTEEERKKERSSVTDATADPSRVCSNPDCAKSLDGYDARYRYCSADCRKAANRSRQEVAESGSASPVRAFMEAYEERLGYSPEPYAGNAAAAKRLLERYPSECLLAAYDAAKREPYWKAKPLSVMSLAKQVGPLLAAGKVRGWTLEDGRAVPGKATKKSSASALGSSASAYTLEAALRAAQSRGDTETANRLREQMGRVNA